MRITARWSHPDHREAGAGQERGDRTGEGYREVLEGVREGEDVVTAATFLIDSESNLRAALKTFTQPEPPK